MGREQRGNWHEARQYSKVLVHRSTSPHRQHNVLRLTRLAINEVTGNGFQLRPDFFHEDETAYRKAGPQYRNAIPSPADVRLRRPGILSTRRILMTATK